MDDHPIQTEGPRMANLELTLRDIIGLVANAAALTGGALLALALCAEWVRRHHSGSNFVRCVDRVIPATVHRIAVGILTLLATVASVVTPSVASADTSLRGWLESPSVPTTVVTPAPVPNPTSPLPAPIAPPTPSAAPVLHPHTSAAPPPSSPGPTRSPSTRALTPVAPAKPTPTAPADPQHAVDSSVQYVVVAGDCLWDIAARLIGSGASNAAIDRGWRAIYAANRAAIGADPGLIHPGLVLTIPALDPTP